MVQNALASFGAGRLYGTRTDVTGSTPREFGVLQDTTFDFSFTTKPLMGSNQFAVFVARGEAKWTAKAKVGILSGALLNDIFFGQTMSAGETVAQFTEPHSIPASTPFTIAVSPPNSGTFVQDFGVINVAAGQPMQLVASGPTTGQYSQAAGTYTFAAADDGIAVAISYTYSESAVGQTITLTNQLLGTTPTFSSVFRNRDARSGQFTTWSFNRMTSSKLSIASKTSDYAIPEFDMEIMDDGTGKIGTMSFGDLS